MFTNPQTQKAFKAMVVKDRMVRVPAAETHGEYYGLLSTISVPVAETMLQQGVNLLERSSPVAAKPEAGK